MSKTKLSGILAAVVAVVLLFILRPGCGIDNADVESKQAASADAAGGERSSLGDGPRAVPSPLALANDPRGSISGRLTSSEGGPVPGADVCAATSDQHLDGSLTKIPRCTTSGPDGAYQLTGLFRVPYGVSAAARGFIPRAYGDQEDSFIGLRLDRSEDVTNIDLVLTPGGVELAGVVKDLSGGVVEGAVVHSRLDSSSSAPATGAIAMSDAEGKFSLWVKEGDRSVSATADGYTSAWDSGIAPGRFFTLILTPESVLSGTVRGDDGTPVAGARVKGSGTGFGSSGAAISDEDGRYRLEGLSAGRYKPHAVAPGLAGMAKQSVRLSIGESADGVDVYVYKHARVIASVTDPDGEPCERGSVRLKDHKTKVNAGERIRDGVAEIDAVQPGIYDVSVDCDGFVPGSEYPSVQVSDEDVRVQYTVEAGVVVVGIVVNAAGDPVENAAVSAVNSVKKSFGGGWTRTKGETGRFELEGLEPGEYEIEVYANKHPSLPEPLSLTIVAGETPEELRIELREGGTIRGAVLSASGDPVPGASASARGAKHHNADVRDDGTFEMLGVDPGDYVVTVRGTRWSDTLRKPGSSDDDNQSKSVHVEVGQEVTVEFVVEARDGTIEGTVVDEAGGPLADAYLSVTRQSDSAAAGAGNAKRASRWSWGVDPILSDVDGKFTASGLSPGQYTIRAYRKGGGEGFVEDVGVGTNGVQIQMQLEGTVSGTVKVATGAPPERFKITVRDPNSAFSRSEDFVRTDGVWFMDELAAGSLHVSADSPEGSVEQKDIALNAGGEVTGVDLTLVGRTTIRGRVLDLETKEPVAGVVVQATTGGNFSISFGGKHGKELTDSDGRYVVENAPTGKINLSTAPASFADFGKVNWGSMVVVAEPGKELEAPDLMLVAKRVKENETAGDLGFKIAKSDLGKEDLENPPKMVAFVRPGGPAAESGLKVGDVIVAVDGHDVNGEFPGHFRSLTQVTEGTTVTLKTAAGETISVTAGPPV